MQNFTGFDFVTELLERLNCNLKTASFVLGSPEINLFACDQLWSTMETTGIPVIVLPDKVIVSGFLREQRVER